jgi:hypothetical protein
MEHLQAGRVPRQSSRSTRPRRRAPPPPMAQASGAGGDRRGVPPWEHDSEPRRRRRDRDKHAPRMRAFRWRCGLERWIAAQRWNVVPVAGSCRRLPGLALPLETDQGGVRVSAFMSSGDPAVWVVPRREAGADERSAPQLARAFEARNICSIVLYRLTHWEARRCCRGTSEWPWRPAHYDAPGDAVRVFPLGWWWSARGAALLFLADGLHRPAGRVGAARGRACRSLRYFVGTHVVSGGDAIAASGADRRRLLPAARAR